MSDNSQKNEPLRKKRAMWGFGSVRRRGRIWWIYYSYQGREYPETSRSESETVARALLKKRLAEIGRGRFIGPREERITFEDLSAALITDYQINDKRSIRSAELSISHLKESFEFYRAVDIRTEQINTHTLMRQESGAANASINRELSCLKRMFSLAVRGGRLGTAPYIPMLEENNAREGFLDHAGFLSLRCALPEYLKGPISFLYLSGWRLGEMQSLEWRDIDTAGGVIRLRSENSKNKNPRILPLRGELCEIIQRARDRRRLDLPLVFHREGRRIGDFRKAWETACKAAGLKGIIVHDLRRTAVRNMVRSGIPERVAMSLSGHKTRSVFDRYNIVSEADLSEAAEKLHSHLSNQPVAPKVTRIG